MRWLGFWLDRKLSWRTHTQKWTAKASTVSNLLRRIANTKHGPPPNYTRKAVKACVEPMLLYGAAAWYPGNREDGRPVKYITLLRKMKNVYHSALRAVAPVWKTTPLAALYRESGFPPLEILLESHRRRYAARLLSLDADHPLTTRTTTHGNRRTPLTRTADMLPRAPRPLLLPRSPPIQPVTASKATAALDFQRWLSTVPRRDLVVYSDGSMQDHGVGFGYSICRNGRQIAQGCGGLRSAEVFDAEVIGAAAGLEHALKATTHKVPIHVCLDNAAAIMGL
jgi:hypothetical protein